MGLVRTRMGWFALLLWAVAAAAMVWLAYSVILDPPKAHAPVTRLPPLAA